MQENFNHLRPGKIPLVISKWGEVDFLLMDLAKSKDSLENLFLLSKFAL